MKTSKKAEIKQEELEKLELINKLKLSGYVISLFLHEIINYKERDKLLKKIWEVKNEVRRNQR